MPGRAALAGGSAVAETHQLAFSRSARATLNALYAAAEGIGVQICHGAEVVGLEIEDGGFERARLADGSTVEAGACRRRWRVRVQDRLLKRHRGDAVDNLLIRGTNNNRGTILKLLLDSSVQEIGNPTQCHAVAIARGNCGHGILVGGAAGLLREKAKVVLTIAGWKQWLWRAVDQNGWCWTSWCRAGATRGVPNACSAEC